MPRRQRIVNIKCSPEPTRLFSKNGNDYAEYVFEEPNESFKIRINIKAKTFKYDLFTARSKKNPLIPRDFDPNEFLRHEPNLEKDAPLIQQIAKSIKKRATKAATIKNCRRG